MLLSERKFLKLIRKAYMERLLEALGEADLVNDRGDVLITRDLKVRHKKSGYEYTVDDVVKQGDSLKVILRSPETPRVEDPGAEMLLGEPKNNELLGEEDMPPEVPAGAEASVSVPDVTSLGGDDFVDEEVYFIIDEEEFEKDYEVK